MLASRRKLRSPFTAFPWLLLVLGATVADHQFQCPRGVIDGPLRNSRQCSLDGSWAHEFQLLDDGDTVEEDEVVPLFPSFDEWKKEASAQGNSANSPRQAPVSQNPEHYTSNDPVEQSDPSTSVSPPSSPSGQTETRSDQTRTQDDDDAAKVLKNPKQRFNYASFDCGAVILATNPGAKSATAILSENKDHYMLNTCDVPEKFVVVELCGEIKIETIVLANYEFFSSMFNQFRVSASDRYPPKKDWVVLSQFEAKNKREPQVFRITTSNVWARYIRIDFLTHYGNEFYCPLSLLRVYGKTMMEDLIDTKNDIPPPAPLTQNVTIPSDKEAGKIVESPEANEKVSSSTTVSTETTVTPFETKVAAATPSAQAREPSDRNTAILTEIMDTPVKLVDTTVTTISPAPSPSSVQPKQQPQSPSPSPQVQQQQQHVETPVPEVGENVFRTILKRLSQLEENVTLSQSYLEEQSRRLQEVFHDLEQSHRERMAVILEANKETLETSFTDLRVGIEEWWAQIRKELNEYRAKLKQERSQQGTSLRSLSIQLAVLQYLVLALLIVVVALAAETSLRTKNMMKSLRRRWRAFWTSATKERLQAQSSVSSAHSQQSIQNSDKAVFATFKAVFPRSTSSNASRKWAKRRNSLPNLKLDASSK